MDNPNVHIVILNYIRWEDTRDCLASVLQSAYSNYSVFVIDNHSGNNSIKQLTDWVDTEVHSSTHNWPVDSADYTVVDRENFIRHPGIPQLPRLTFIQNEKNNGFAGGNNIVLRVLAGMNGYVWLLNPDMTVEPTTLPELVAFAGRQHPESIIGATIRSFTGNRDLLFYGGGRVNFLSATVKPAKSREDAGQLDYISGGCLFTAAINFKKRGLLPEPYFLYWEETDWCYSAKQQGYNLLLCPAAICYDKISTVIGKGFLANYYYCRNGLLFISTFRKKNIPLALLLMKTRWLKRVLTGQWAQAKGTWRGTIDFLKKNFHEIQ